MGIVLLSINGVGMGHLSRMVEVADYLYEQNERPILFYQSRKFPFKNKAFHKVQIESLLKASPEYLRIIEDKINTSCRIGEPRVFIEDTHPGRINLNSDLSKFLIIRPTTFPYLLSLKEKYEYVYKGFFIADHLESPTWPYTVQETEEIKKWERFYQVGPIFRKPLKGGLQAIKLKYKWRKDIPIVVFSMGGGGTQIWANDHELFLSKITPLADQIRSKYSNARLLFIKGPLYPADAPLPQGFEIINVEEDMPSLFAIAKMAIIRPGFNTLWECIYTQTPFYYIEGATYSEPIIEKLSRLEQLGLVSNSNAFNEDYHNRYKLTCRKVISKWTGKPDKVFLDIIKNNKVKNEWVNRNSTVTEVSVEVLEGLRRKFREASEQFTVKKFFIRIDDVVELTEELSYILSLVNEFNIFTSLEVIPYLNKLTENELTSFDPDFRNIIIAQHGFGHVVNVNNQAGIKSEFLYSDQANEEEIENLVLGKKKLEKQFPNRFSYGFSSPFDCFPNWLPNFLENNSWKYMLINQRQYVNNFLAIKARVDIWDWNLQRIKDVETLFERILLQVREDGHFGLILHPVFFTSRYNRDMLKLLLTELKAAGYESYKFLK